MKYAFTLCLVTVCITFVSAQPKTTYQHINRKGRWYVYWGWNWSDYTKSDITFEGEDYHFTLQQVVARDSPSNFTLEKYFGVRHFSIPQFNFRLGYCLSSHWDISFGMDHMKYVVVQNQETQIDGYIDHENSSYNGEYTAENIVLSEDFLQFEHTDGLNYENIEARYSARFVDLNKITFNYTAGVGIGMMLPKTNTILLDMPRHDDYHLSGYGIGGIIGVNVLFFDHFFMQAELKSGVINMPDIRTTFDPGDRAHQQFVFLQRNIVFGAVFGFGRSPRDKTIIE